MNPLRRLAGHPRVEPFVSTILRSRLVDHSVRFALREWGLRPGAHVYRVRETGLRTLIAHGTADVHGLDQSFYQHSHEPPPGALARLTGLRHPLRALDVGANVGMWGLWLIGRFDVSRIVGLEPDPDNVARHRRQIALNHLGGIWTVRGEAATVADGPVHFAPAQTNGAIVGDARDDALEVPGVDVFTLVRDIDLLKIDIEGGEWPLLADPRFARLDVPVVMLEFHPDGSPGDPRETAARALTGAGYTIELAHEGPAGFGTWWGHRA